MSYGKEGFPITVFARETQPQSLKTKFTMTA